MSTKASPGSVIAGSGQIEGSPPVDDEHPQATRRSRGWGTRLPWPPSGLWRHPDFMRLWAADTVSQFGSQVTLLALPLTAALTLDASAAQMGFLTAAGTLPWLLIGLFAGAWVDRRRRRPVLVAADLARAFLLLAVPAAWALDALSIELLYAVAFLVGCLTVFFDVAYLAFLPALVRRDQLLEGNSKLGASASVAQFAGPGVAGGLVSLVSAPFAILLDGLSFLLSAFFLRQIRATEPAPVASASGRRVRAEIAEGLGMVLRDPILRALTGCGATTTLFGYAFLAVYVLYMTDHLGLGPGAIGAVFALGGFGALLGAMAAGPAARRFGVGPTIIWGRVLVGLGGMVIPVAVLVPAVALPLVVAAEFFQWLMLVLSDVNSLSLRQAVTPDRLQGRINATYRVLVWGFQPVGALLGGALGSFFGPPSALVIGVLGMLAAVIWVYWSPLRGLYEVPAMESAVQIGVEPA